MRKYIPDKITEDIYDFFNRNIDEDDLKDRINQTKRARDAALRAATKAEANGNTDAAEQLRADADRLQQVLDDTTANNNTAYDDPDKGPGTGDGKEEKSKEVEDPDEPSTADEPDKLPKSNQSGNPPGSPEPGEPSDPEDFESPNTPGDFTSPGEPKEPTDPAESQEPGNKNKPDRPENPENPEKPDGSTEPGDPIDPDEPNDPTDSTDSETPKKLADPMDPSNPGDPGDDYEDDDDNEGDDDNEDDDGNQDAGDDDDDDDEDAFGPPKIKDDKILQDPFKSNQIPRKLPKNIQNQVDNGSLEIESEIDAIIRILSRLKGEARRGAETALRDLYSQLDFWGGDIDED